MTFILTSLKIYQLGSKVGWGGADTQEDDLLSILFSIRKESMKIISLYE
jgi:hypothetical protein